MELENFEGIRYRISDNWFPILDVNEFNNKPINYLEIGTLCGANVLSVAKSYGMHSDSKLYCIDPWDFYKDYDETYNQYDNYKLFLKNISNSDKCGNIVIYRNYSNIVVPTFQNDFFDMIYIDGNHETEYVLEDAVLSFRKLKKGGVMIFDDYSNDEKHKTRVGIDSFLFAYSKKISILGVRDVQIIIRRIE